MRILFYSDVGSTFDSYLTCDAFERKRETERQRDRQKERQTDRQTDRDKEFLVQMYHL